MSPLWRIETAPEVSMQLWVQIPFGKMIICNYIYFSYDSQPNVITDSVKLFVKIILSNIPIELLNTSLCCIHISYYFMYSCSKI